MPTKVRVAVRMRPMLAWEKAAGQTDTRIKGSPEHQEVVLEEEDRTKRTYRFDQVLAPSTSQPEVFERLQIPWLINKVIEGYNATMFAYGQTSSGKTYTMEGYEYQNKGGDRAPKLIIKSDEDYGLVQRSIIDIYRQLEQRSQGKLVRTSVSCSFIQIYNEKIYDLLNIQNVEAGLRIRWSKEEQFAVENLYSVECPTSGDAIKVYNYGIKNRIMATHKLNIASSRSHTIFTVTVKTTYLNKYNNVITGKLQLVDLAGSEKTSQTGNIGRHFKESIDINKSLFALRKVILALTENQHKKVHSFIPYRDSKLTSLLKHCLGGNSFCLMIACVAPLDDFFEETMSTLTYAAKASQIVNDPTINEDPRVAMIFELNKKVQLLEQELSKAQEHIALLTQIAGSKIEPEPKSIPIKPPDPPKRELSPIIGQKPPSIQAEETKKAATTPSNGIETRVETILSESVNMVKELLQSNRQLREIIDQKSQDAEKFQNEVVVLQLENQDLKDKIDVFSRLVRPPNTDDIVNLDPRRLFSDDPQLALGGGEKLAQEVLELRRANRTLEDRVKHLEQHNNKITKGLVYMGNIEPAKPSFQHLEETYTCNPRDSERRVDEGRKKSTTRLKRATPNSAIRGQATSKPRSGSAMLKRGNPSTSFYASEVQVTKNVWAPTTVYAIGPVTNQPRLNNSSGYMDSAKTLDEQHSTRKVAAISKLSEILNNRMKLYH